MAVVVVGGHSRNVGKTSVVAGLVRAMPEMRWTAVKITQYGHGICSANGEACDCQTADHRAAISVERDAASGTDTSRYLAAGAERSLWVRTEQGHLAEAMPRLRKELAATENAGGNAIVESNSLMQFLRPDLYLAVLDPANRDFKASALRFLDRADAVLWVGDEEREVEWENVSLKLIRHF
jgi:molybdopterin-guanine dinucleotide biosynthesis protein